MTKIRPLHDEVVVRLDPADEISSGGILIPEIAKMRTRFAEVLAVGPGLFHTKGKLKGQRKEMGVKAGDRVLLRELFDHEELKTYADGGATLHILREDDVLAVVAA